MRTIPLELLQRRRAPDFALQFLRLDGRRLRCAEQQHHNGNDFQHVATSIHFMRN